MPPPVRSRSPTRPTGVPSRSAARSSRRASRRPTIRTPAAPRVRTNQACSAGSSIVSIGATAPPTREARNRAGSSSEPKWRPTKRTALPGTNASATSSGVSSVEPLVDPARVDGRRPGDLEVVAGVVAEGGADEAFERARVGRGGPDRAACRGRRPPGPRRRGEVAPRLGRAIGCEPVPEVAGEVGEPEQRPLGQAAGQPRGRDQRRPRSRRDEPPLDAASSRPLRRPGVWSSGRAAGRGRTRVRPAGLHRARPALEVGGLLGGRRPHRLEAVPLLGRRRRSSGPARRRSPGSRAGGRPGPSTATSIGSAQRDVRSGRRAGGS